MTVNSVDNVETQSRVSSGKAALLGSAVGATGGWLYGNRLMRSKEMKDVFIKAAEDFIDKNPNINLKDFDKIANKIFKIGKRAIKASSALIFGVIGAGLFAAGTAIYNKIKS